MKLIYNITFPSRSHYFAFNGKHEPPMLIVRLGIRFPTSAIIPWIGHQTCGNAGPFIVHVVIVPGF
jgi:hypothetical protein